MEVRGLGQGGQNTFDFSIKNANTETNVTTNEGNKEIVLENNKPNNENSDEEQKVKKAVDKLNKIFEDTNTHVEYEVHEVFGDIMIKFVDNQTKKVISEVPPKKILDMVAKICEMAGIIVNDKA